MWDALWINAKLATMAGTAPFGLIESGALAAEKGKIAWLGPMQALPGRPSELARLVHDLDGRVMTPGLVDPHTHIVFVGDGLADFEVLIAGGTRADFNKSGGIMGMVYTNRKATDEQLYKATVKRVSQLIASGVTTMESKSGAGLDLDTELRLMRISRELGRNLPLTVVSTFLGTHGIAPEYKGRADDYVEFMCKTVIPAAQREGLIDQVDGFCDLWGFSIEQMSRIFDIARANGWPVKLHAEQYRDYGAAGLVARYKGVSADHLEYVAERDVAAMAEAGTVATLLPGANWTLGEKNRPPVAMLRRYGVPMAMATNCNPVSSPTTMPTQIMNMGCRMFGLTTEEAVAAFTRNSAKALGLGDSRGTLEVGKVADLAIWNIDKPGELTCRIAESPCHEVVKDGAVVYRARAPEIARPSAA